MSTPEFNPELGYLMHFKGHGVYSPGEGKVDYTQEQVDEHNRLLDEALLTGLDDNCEIGQGYTFYWSPGDCQVKTWLGTVVGPVSRTSGRTRVTVWFSRKGKHYKGTAVPRVHSLLRFRRVG